MAAMPDASRVLPHCCAPLFMVNWESSGGRLVRVYIGVVAYAAMSVMFLLRFLSKGTYGRACS